MRRRRLFFSFFFSSSRGIEINYESANAKKFTKKKRGRSGLKAFETFLGEKKWEFVLSAARVFPASTEESTAAVETTAHI